MGAGEQLCRSKSSGGSSPVSRQNDGTNVEGVSRFTQNGQTENVEAGQYAGDCAAPAEQTPVIAPGCDGQGRLLVQPAQPTIVFGTDRISTGKQSGWRACPESEQIANGERAEPPSFCEPDTAPDGRIVGLFVCRGGVEHHEEHLRARAPASPERVAIMTAMGRFGEGLHQRSYSRGRRSRADLVLPSRSTVARRHDGSTTTPAGCLGHHSAGYTGGRACVGPLP